MSDKALALYRELSRHQALKKAYIVAEQANSVLVESEWGHRNLSSLKHVTNTCSQVVTASSISSPRFAPMLENVVIRGRSGEHSAMLVQSGGGEDKEDSLIRYILFHQPSQPPLVIDLSATKLHANVYADDELGCMSFSPDHKQLAFVAEEHRPKPSSLLTASEEEENSTTKSGRGQKFVRRPDWGEQFTGKHRSVVVVIPCKDTASVAEKDSGRVVLTPPLEYAGVGQLLWAGPDSLLGVAYIDASPRLGLIYCRIREAVLFHVSLKDGIFRELTPRNSWVGFPRFSPDLSRLVYMRGPVGGPHCNGTQLITRPWGPQPQIQPLDGSIVVDYVESEQKLPEGGSFFGLLGITSLPQRCFLNSTTLVFTTYAPFALHTYSVNIESKVVRQILHQEEPGSVTVLDATPQFLVYSTSSFTVAPSLLLATVEDAHIKESRSLVTGSPVEGVPRDWQKQWLLDAKPPHPVAEFKDVPVPILYCGPTSQQQVSSPVPLIMYVHGGPHSAFANSFTFPLSWFVSLGYAVVFPNYRGSLGVGRKGILSLPGHCGTVDVEDCHAVAQECLDRFSGIVDPNNVYLYGGSHGGYLVTYLSAKYPDFYRAVSTRNPVTDIASMVSISDIPDWTHLEAGTGVVEETFSAPTAAALDKMSAVSPLPLIDNVKAPTLMLIGTQDRRVPSSQGWKYYELLKHRGVPASCLAYPDCHPLSKVDVEADTLLQTVAWFDKFAHKTK